MMPGAVMVVRCFVHVVESCPTHAVCFSAGCVHASVAVACDCIAGSRGFGAAGDVAALALPGCELARWLH